MILNELIKNIDILNTHGNMDVMVNALSFDSRNVNDQTLFVAIRGTQFDGHNFLQDVADKACRIAVVEKIDPSLSMTQLQVKDTSEALAFLADNFYGNPSKDMTVVGITGTNGKTTTTTLLFDLFRSLGYKCGLISTVVNKINDEAIPSTHTTPNPIALSALFQQMKSVGCNYVFMEVSSHALHQKRVSAIDFDVAIFSNITHDHLDYHKTFQEYIQVKKSFFDNLKKEAVAIVNIDDRNGRIMVQNCPAAIQTYALKSPADIKGKIIENALSGLVMTINSTEIYTQMIGEFNAYNLLAVYGASMALQQDELTVLTKMSELKSVDGRFQFFKSTLGTTCIVDYAHTPDALENVLKTILTIGRDSQILTVVGCGGDRDKTKRPEMANIAALKSHKVILTSDNPRTEDPSAILDDMEAGIPLESQVNCLRISDRKEAIKTAISLAQPKDILLIAGKGHEKYQDIKGVKHDFDDFAIAQELFTKMKK